MALDWSFEPNPDLKGAYYRRLEDIPEALAKFDVTTLPANSLACAIRRLLFRGGETGEGNCRHKR
jgi:hypothetical protein